MSTLIHQQVHGYRSGHQLLQASIELDRRDQDLVDGLSDMAGPLRPGEQFAPYLSCYPLPSELYYVFSRTTQDLEALRAGCVITKTLLVPMGYWMEEADPNRLVSLFNYDFHDKAVDISRVGESNALPEIRAEQLLPLVEAIFLERRLPIVAFNVPDPWDVAIRLLTAFWPGYRKKFSLCTFSLAPRTLLKEPFDVLFAPITAKSRFSDWQGRRIEISERPVSARHKWSRPIAHRIFEGRWPHVFESDSLGVMSADHQGNEAALRITLLWDELRESLPDMPDAALGMLDIAKSLEIQHNIWNILESAICDSMEDAPTKLSAKEAWDMILTLLAKLDESEVTPKVSLALRSSVTKLTARDYQLALKQLDNLQIRASARMSIEASMALGLLVLADDDLFAAFRTLSPSSLTRLLTASNDLLRHVFHQWSDSQISYVVNELTDAVNIEPIKGDQRVILMLAPYLTNDASGSLLKEVLDHAQAETFCRSVREVWRNWESHTPLISTIICVGAHKASLRKEVRDVFASLASDAQTLQNVLQLTSATREDVEWILKSHLLEANRAFVLDQFILRLDREELLSAFESIGFATLSFELLRTEEYYDSAARIVAIAPDGVEKFIDRATSIIGFLDASHMKMMARALLDKVSRRPTALPEDLVGSVFAVLSTCLEPQEVLTGLLKAKLEKPVLSEFFVEIDRASNEVRKKYIGWISLIVQLITERRSLELSADGVASIARLVHDAFDFEPDQVRTSSYPLLSKAMSATSAPVTPILEVAFPTVYQQLRESRRTFDLVFTVFNDDWDKCKTARANLVRAFMKSLWPPRSLATIAYTVDDMQRIFLRVLKEHNGEKYLDRVIVDVSESDMPDRSAILNALEQARARTSYIYESDT